MQYVYNISIIFCLFFLSSCDQDPLGLTKKHLYEDYYLHAFFEDEPLPGMPCRYDLCRYSEKDIPQILKDYHIIAIQKQNNILILQIGQYNGQTKKWFDVNIYKLDMHTHAIIRLHENPAVPLVPIQLFFPQ